MAGTLPVAALSRLAWRNLWRNYRRTLIMLLAISVGVWAMIFMTALMRGMVDQMVEDGIDALPGYVQVHHPAVLRRPEHRKQHARTRSVLCACDAVARRDRLDQRVRVPSMISSERDNRGVTLLGVTRTVKSLSVSTLTAWRGACWNDPTTRAWLLGGNYLNDWKRNWVNG